MTEEESSWKFGKLIFIPVGVGITGIALLIWWFLIPSPELGQRLPHQANIPQTGRPSVELKGRLVLGSGLPARSRESWPRFRGGNFDNRAMTSDPLRVEISADPPRQLWSIPVGEGYAGAAIHHGCVYLLDYDRSSQADVLRCLSLDQGQMIWEYAYPVKIKRNHGMSRTVCAVNDKYVVSFGPKCHVACLDSRSGEEKWLIDLTESYGATVPLWYAGQCPLLEEDRVILAVGGDSLLVALDCQSGQILWETPNPRQWKMTHSSIMPMTLDSRRTYVYCASGGVVGVAAENGKLLWETDEWTIRIANVPSPLIIPLDRIFLSGGYNAGSMMIRIAKSADGIYTPEILYRLDPGVFGATQHTPIYHQGHIYGVREDEELVCLDLDGQVVWSSGSQYRFGLGPYMLIGDYLYLLDDDGLLSIVHASSKAFQLQGQSQALTGHEAWGPMAYADGHLIVRDLTTMACLDLGSGHGI